MTRAFSVVVAVFLLTACGAKEEPALPAAAAVTPVPSIDFADVSAGVEYTTRVFEPAITFTLPAGEWKLAGGDSPDHVEIEADPVDPVDAAGIGFHHMTQVFDPDLGGETPGDAVPGPEDFAAWLTSHPHLKTTRPEPVEALGLKGVSIDVRAVSSQRRQYKDCGKLEGPICVAMYVGKIEPYVYGRDTFGRFLVLEQPDGRELVVEQFVEPAAAAKAQLKVFEAIVAGASAG